MSERGLRLLASGFYGGFNLGDEAVLAGLLRLLTEAPCHVDLTVLSGNPSLTSKSYSVHSLSRALTKDVLPRALALRRSQALILGGGGLLQDISGRRGIRGTLGRTLSLAAWANRAGVPLLFWGVGVGPLQPQTVPPVARALRRASLVAVRDEASHALCQDLGVESRIVPDHAWALQLPLRTGGDRLGISLRRWPGLDIPAVARGLRAVQSRWRRPALFLALEAEDLEVGRLLQQALGSGNLEVPDALPTLDGVIDQYRECAGVVAMRLHAGLLAAAQGIPSVGIAYDAKVSELHRALDGGGLWLPVSEAAQAPALLAQMLSQRSDWPERLRTYAAAQQRAAHDAARDILRGLCEHV
ncbi:MAG: polysaccharide pyruvyl transferase family protein [Thermaerobacter sp.]|nr:polysaccharide pyruvyl transferase family protein [Thermaerobacter sp.]